MNGPMQGSNGWAFRVPPGWPVPPAGWTPPPGWQPDPSWPPPPAGWQLWVPAQPLVPAQRRTTVEDHWPTPRRSQGARAGLMALYVIGLLGASFILAVLVGLPFALHLNPADYPTDAAYDAAWDRAYDNAAPAILGAVLAFHLTVFGILGRRAGYRGAGFLLVLVPIYSWVVMSRVLWRWTDIKHWAVASGTNHLPHYQHADAWARWAPSGAPR